VAPLSGAPARARTWLFVPADRPERFARAAASGADRVILDLEDAVAPDAKDDARRLLARAPLPAGVPLWVRVNGAATPWLDADLAAAAALPVAGIVLPKAEGAADVARAAAALPNGFRVVPLVETARGAWDVLDIARAPRVERLAFGAVDFQLDTGLEDAAEGGALDAVRTRLALASRVAGLAPPLDSVCLAIDDEDALAADAARGRRFGCGGKLCIHPRQVPVVHRAYRPGADEVAWARAVLAAAAARPDGGRVPFAFRGALVDRPVLERARRVEALADEG
jgi:citrate lyase subunit beta/citryl-CoA lyase